MQRAPLVRKEQLDHKVHLESQVLLVPQAHKETKEVRELPELQVQLDHKETKVHPA